MGDGINRAATAPAPAEVPPPPTRSSHVWIVVAGLVLFIVVAVALGIHFQVIPLGLAKAAPSSRQQQKSVVRYVLATAPGIGGRTPGSVYIAEIRGDNELSLSFEVGGVVDVIGPSKSRTWDPGTSVAAGTELGHLKQDDFVNRIVAAQARAQLARVTYERMENLFKTEAIPKQKLDQAETEYKAAKADLAAAEQALKDTVLRAPWDGTILERMISEAETVGPGRPVLSFSNLRRMTVEVGVPDTALSQVKIDQEVPVEISALPGRVFVGRISQVAIKGEAASRLFKVKIKVANPEGLIKSGMTASVSFARLGSLPAGAVWVPLAALTAESSSLSVFVVEGNKGEGDKVRKRPVKTDEIAGNQILVTEGLKPDDKVVVAGVATLYDGAPVDARPME